MSVRSREEAIQVFGERLQAFGLSLRESIDQFYKVCGPVAFAFEGWTKASIIRDLTKERVVALVAKDVGLRLMRKGNATSVDVEGKFNVRIKKLDEKLRARVSKTRASRAFDRNQPSLDLRDRPATNTYFGYAPTENDPLRPQMYLVCHDENGKNAWEPIPILLEDTPSLISAPTQEPATAQPRSRAKVKRVRRRAENE